MGIEVTKADRDAAAALFSSGNEISLIAAGEWDSHSHVQAFARHRQQAIAQHEPVPMLLFCPKCGLQHIDEPDERTPEWDNPPHKSHVCHGCGCIWRPADVPTEGVASIKTVGKSDTWTIAQHEGGRGEPVAWMYECNGCLVLKKNRTPEYTSPVMGHTETPLYAHPPATRPTALAEDIGNCIGCGAPLRVGQVVTAWDDETGHYDCSNPYSLARQPEVDAIKECPPPVVLIGNPARYAPLNAVAATVSTHPAALAEDEMVKKAEQWLRAIGTWLLETDSDMKLPDGVLDTDPEDIADALAAISPRIAQQTEEVARLREALKKVGSGCTTRPDDIENPTVLWMQDIARAALNEQPGGEGAE